MIDKLNRLEKFRIIKDAHLWREITSLRNHLAHEYPEQPELTAKYLNLVYELSKDLLIVLHNITDRINTLNV